MYQNVNRLRSSILALIQNTEYEAYRVLRKVPGRANMQGLF